MARGITDMGKVGTGNGEKRVNEGRKGVAPLPLFSQCETRIHHEWRAQSHAPPVGMAAAALSSAGRV